MKLKMLERILTIGLIIKVAALLLAVVISGPSLTYGPTVAGAQEQQQEEARPEGDTAEATEAAEGEKAEGEATEAPPSQATQYDPRLIELLENKQKSLALEEERIQRERQELENLRKDVNERIDQLKKVQAALDDMIDKQNKQRQERITQLVKVLSNMRPQPAADVITKLDINMAVEVFRRMQSRTAGKVMAALKPDKAARISTLLTQQEKAAKAAQVAKEAAEATGR